MAEMQQEIANLRQQLHLAETSNVASVFNGKTTHNKKLLTQIADSAVDLAVLSKERKRSRGSLASCLGLAVEALMGLLLGYKWVVTRCHLLVECIFEGYIYDKNLYKDALLDRSQTFC